MTFAIIAIWFVLALLLNIAGVFEARADQAPIALGLSVVGPPILFGALYLYSNGFRSLVLALDLKLLTAIQAWRFAGVMFLVLYFYNMLPGTFAWPAGVGDIVVGAYAPFVVVAIANGSPSWHFHAVAFNILGLIDIVGAIGSDVLSGGTPFGILTGPGEVTSDIMQSLPLALIPTFLVPLFIVLHIISLIKLRKGTEG